MNPLNDFYLFVLRKREMRMLHLEAVASKSHLPPNALEYVLVLRFHTVEYDPCIESQVFSSD